MKEFAKIILLVIITLIITTNSQKFQRKSLAKKKYPANIGKKDNSNKNRIEKNNLKPANENISEETRIKRFR